MAVYIKEISTGRVLVDHNSQLALTPASVMKTVTTASALSLQGPDKHFETSVALRGRVDGHRLRGDVVINSCADPTLESENFPARKGFCDSIVAALRARGITEIDGTVIVRQSLKDAGPLSIWQIEDVAWPYGAGLYGFNWRDNVVTIYPNTGRITPQAPGMTIDLIRSNAGNDIVRGVYSNKVTVFARNAKPDWGLSTTVPDPSAVFGAMMSRKLAQAGISVGETPTSASDAPETVIMIHRSPAFAEIMRNLMVHSNNLYAEGMLRSLAPLAFRKDAINREKELWNTRGVSTSHVIISDGSGLSRTNRLSASFLGEMLLWMARSQHGDLYASFFPKAGLDGTLRGTLRESPLKGTIALKTGSVAAVQCYAGYKLDADGHPTHVIVIMVDGFFCHRGQVKRATEQLLETTFL